MRKSQTRFKNIIIGVEGDGDGEGGDVGGGDEGKSLTLFDPQK